jgi:glycosyltransferase involved in cell wall biosynthesis
MRVLHVHSGNMFGGVERLLETLASHRGACPTMEPAFALCFEGRLAEALRGAGAPVEMLGPVRASRFWQVRARRQQLAEVIARTRPDVAVVHSSWSQAIFGSAARRRGVSLVRWLHAPQSGDPVLEWAARHVPADLLICNSRYTCEASTGRFPESPRRTCYYPVPAPELESNARDARVELGTPGEVVVILIAARMEAWKGHRLLLEALSRMAADARWHCWVAGGAQTPREQVYLEALKAQAAGLRLEGRVQFLGERSDIERLLKAADIYCQPNQGPEPFGLSFVEALAAGLPVVSTRLGALPELVDEGSGILVEPDAPDALANALSTLLDACTRGAASASATLRARSFCDVPARLAELANAFTSVARLPVLQTIPVES